MHERSILGWLLIGLVAGILGKVVMPGRDPGGFIVTILIGIAGALLAGFVAQSLGWTLTGGWANYGAATAGAVVLLILYRLVVARRVR
ncbi:GlsB/YeaQ/YmgE family stress response membrane protein [uncultured Sphingomonas sp.]|uniref:GlsB/YeaQ/YmgE family stress response membrane protein n=1 Tax=uncultured Sphingomonas sp. TaxID=158754 RepID=UPI0035C9BA4F